MTVQIWRPELGRRQIDVAASWMVVGARMPISALAAPGARATCAYAAVPTQVLPIGRKGGFIATHWRHYRRVVCHHGWSLLRLRLILVITIVGFGGAATGQRAWTHDPLLIATSVTGRAGGGTDNIAVAGTLFLGDHRQRGLFVEIVVVKTGFILAGRRRFVVGRIESYFWFVLLLILAVLPSRHGRGGLGRSSTIYVGC
mmetsp:Transcript_32124/g.77685  ORF Transcript_32124/g.77685 Transcript_32124/m.77685 type:complete len:200 (+) Transcript_32124:2649-3248(+)